jgi:homoserine kinase type II
MAVYTFVTAEDVAALLQHYAVGDLIALKGIAEGVQNSNYFVETTKGKYFLTLYEQRVDMSALPYFHALLRHLSAAGCKVPSFISDNDGKWLQEIAGRPACLIEFLSGVSVSSPTPAQAHAVGGALAQMHLALSDFNETHPNQLGIDNWTEFAGKCGRQELDDIAPGLAERVRAECVFLENNWPRHLPTSSIHADLFPDNVLLLGDTVSGLIDFYFACTDLQAYDLAVTHAAWCFSDDGSKYLPQIGIALLSGYADLVPVDIIIDAFPVLLRGASLRFLLTRSYDWINTPANALVTRKDPLAFLRRLDFYSEIEDSKALFGR